MPELQQLFDNNVSWSESIKKDDPHSNHRSLWLWWCACGDAR